MLAIDSPLLAYRSVCSVVSHRSCSSVLIQHSTSEFSNSAGYSSAVHAPKKQQQTKAVIGIFRFLYKRTMYRRILLVLSLAECCEDVDVHQWIIFMVQYGTFTCSALATQSQSSLQTKPITIHHVNYKYKKLN